LLDDFTPAREIETHLTGAPRGGGTRTFKACHNCSSCCARPQNYDDEETNFAGEGSPITEKRARAREAGETNEARTESREQTVVLLHPVENLGGPK
jgi:hypothetical protein